MLCKWVLDHILSPTEPTSQTAWVPLQASHLLTTDPSWTHLAFLSLIWPPRINTTIAVKAHQALLLQSDLARVYYANKKIPGVSLVPHYPRLFRSQCIPCDSGLLVVQGTQVVGTLCWQLLLQFPCKVDMDRSHHTQAWKSFTAMWQVSILIIIARTALECLPGVRYSYCQRPCM